jgi:Ribonuclease G/E
LEAVRAREGPSLAALLGAPCGPCAGTGRIGRDSAVAVAALRALRRACALQPEKPPSVTLHPAVADRLRRGDLQPLRQAFEAWAGAPLRIAAASDPLWPRDRFAL